MFPALFANNKTRNGGVPQEGNLTRHLEVFRQQMDELVPQKNNSGLITIDFESWRPILRENFGSMEVYKNVSYEIERDLHPLWPQLQQQAEVCYVRQDIHQ